MGAFRKIAVGILIISLLTFIALFGQLPALKRTPIGWLRRVLCFHLPNGLKRLDSLTTGGVVTTKSQRWGHYLFFEKNPIVLIFFLFILGGSTIFFLFHAVPLLSVPLLLPVFVLLPPPFLLTYLCVTHRGHHITSATHHARLHDYPYDHVLFRPGIQCSTCQLTKPARSKHCSLCGVCVAMCDHHCPWINNCVGRGNYRWFLGLLLSLGVMEMYGAFLSWHILRPDLGAAGSTHAAYFSRLYWSRVSVEFTRILRRGGLSIAGVGLLATSTCLVPLGLLAYHGYLIWAGMTTNESSKWADWRDDMGDGCVFRGERTAVREADRWRAAEARVYPPGLMDEPAVSWPAASNQVVLYMSQGMPPSGQEELWRRVRSLAEVDNVYDLGGWDNLLESLGGR